MGAISRYFTVIEGGLWGTYRILINAVLGIHTSNVLVQIHYPLGVIRTTPPLASLAQWGKFRMQIVIGNKSGRISFI